MSTSPVPSKRSNRRLAAVTAPLAFLGICLGPYFVRLTFPSLYADDIERVSQLQTSTLRGLLFVPFNEHIAPLFQLVSWLCWQAAGRQLARAPLVFTVASFLPFVLTLGLLAWLLRRETGSATAALAAVAVFSLSWVAVETVYWYSASSFMWALLATLAAWLATASAADPVRPRRWPCWLVAGLTSAAAPAFSAIGLLAGPVAAVRALAGGRRFAALAPSAGTLLSLILYGVVHDRAALAANVGHNSGVAAGLLAAARAPAAVLVPALAGLRTWQAHSNAVVAVQVALTAAAFAGLLIRAIQGHDRPLVLGGMALIVGGYTLTFCARASEPGLSLLETQRYHLFPMLGLVFLLAPAFRLALSGFDARPAGRFWAVTALVVLLLLLHYPEMKGRAGFIRYPDQTRTLAAIDRLGAVCARANISRAQALASLDPIETAWTPPGRNALILLVTDVGTSAVADAAVKTTLLAALTPDERRSICGGMDATPYLSNGGVEGPAVSVGRRVGLFRVREGGARRFVSAGWPSFVEYELSGSTPDVAAAIGLDGSGSGDVVELWWRGDSQRWSETRSVRLRLVADLAHPDRPWRLPLGSLPHWDTAEARRVRLLYHAPGPIALSAPRLVR